MKSYLALLLAGTVVCCVAHAQEDSKTSTLLETRDVLLASLEVERKAAIAPLEAEATKSHANATAIYRRVERLQKAKRLSSSGEKALNGFRNEIKEADKLTASFKEKMSVVNESFDQRRLEIFANHVFPGETPPIKMQGRWVTAAEHAEYIEERQAAERQRQFRINGQRLSDWVMQTLGDKYEMKAESRAVALIRQAKIRSVLPSFKPVYALRPDGTKVEMQNAQSNSNTDDTYAYQVTWQTRGGQLMQKNGYVEIGYGNDGTAYLLGVDVPFLNNPLDGAMIATRSTLDNALEQAFGR